MYVLKKGKYSKGDILEKRCDISKLNRLLCDYTDYDFEENYKLLKEIFRILDVDEEYAEDLDNNFVPFFLGEA